MAEVEVVRETTYGRPCRYCKARVGYVAEVDDCEPWHRDDPRVYALARAMAKVFQDRHPTDEQVGWFLEDAEEVVDAFDPPPEKWRVRRLPPSANDGEQGIEVRLRINDVTYVGLEGGKDIRGSVVPLATFRSWHKPGGHGG